MIRLALATLAALSLALLAQAQSRGITDSAGCVVEQPEQVGSVLVAGPPPLAFAKALSPSGCGRIFPFFDGYSGGAEHCRCCEEARKRSLGKDILWTSRLRGDGVEPVSAKTEMKNSVPRLNTSKSVASAKRNRNRT